MSSTRSVPGRRASPNDGLRRRKPDRGAECPATSFIRRRVKPLDQKELESVPLRRAVLAALPLAMAGVTLPKPARAAEPSTTDAAMADRIQALIPDLDAYATRGMKAFDVPGLAIGIVAGDKFVYAKGFGVRSKGGGQPVDTRTVFQIGSATKAFLATSLAIMVDRGRLNWDDRVVDLYPALQLKDPWVTREFRVFDLLAQRSGLPPLVNDMLAMVGFDEAALIGSLRHAEPVSSFCTTFAYTNITHLLASRMVAQAAGVPDWNVVLQKELLDPLGTTRPTQPKPSRGRPTMRTATAGLGRAPSRCRSRQFFLTMWVGPATSTPMSRIWPVGCDCGSGTALLKDVASSRRKILPSREGRRSR